MVSYDTDGEHLLGARLFQTRDPDGLAVSFLEWVKHRDKDE